MAKLWTEDMVDTLLKYVKKRRTTGVIAGVLSKKYNRTISRSAVLGKLWRLGIRHKPQVKSVANKIVAKPPGNKVVAKPPKPAAKHHLEYQTLRNATCTHIEGEPADRGFCGKPSVANPNSLAGYGSWCAEHIEIVYQKSPVKKRQREARPFRRHVQVSKRSRWTSS